MPTYRRVLAQNCSQNSFRINCQECANRAHWTTKQPFSWDSLSFLRHACFLNIPVWDPFELNNITDLHKQSLSLNPRVFRHWKDTAVSNVGSTASGRKTSCPDLGLDFRIPYWPPPPNVCRFSIWFCVGKKILSKETWFSLLREWKFWKLGWGQFLPWPGSS